MLAENTSAADASGGLVPMHRYAVQLTVADVRDGGLSGSTLREAASWGRSRRPVNGWSSERPL